MRDSATRIALWLLLAAALAVAFDNLDRPLANPDEGRYSEISREMAASGDWITPRLNGIKYFEKPPLQYWASAIAFRAFGESEAAARIYTGLCGLATLLLVGFTARRLGTGDHAIASMLALVSSPYFMALGGIVTLDMGLTLWTTLTLCAFLIAQMPAHGPIERRRWLLAAWAGAALAVLSKGLVGNRVSGGGVRPLQRGEARPRRAARSRMGARGSALPHAHGTLVHRGLARQSGVRRVLLRARAFQPIPDHGPSPNGAVVVFPADSRGRIPAVDVRAARGLGARLEREGGTRSFRPLTFAMLWGAFIVAFFSASGSKLPAYILPAFPALALVLGRYLVEAPARRLGLMMIPLAPIALALAWAAWRMP
jgi:4-amino-4-deoxy-L-arabinose transferase-like glycosyltransferase